MVLVGMLGSISDDETFHAYNVLETLVKDSASIISFLWAKGILQRLYSVLK